MALRGSMAGVPVIPDGSMLPHGSEPPETGVPMCVRHSRLPPVSNAYTELFSVATMTRPREIKPVETASA